MKKPLIFISYSHDNIKEKDTFVKFLKSISRDGQFFTWDDTEIKAGQDWNKKIKESIKTCDIAIMLVSVDFLLSDYIIEIEVKALLDRYHNKNDNVILFPIVISPCPWDEQSWLSQIELRPKEDGRVVYIWDESNNEALVNKRLTSIIKQISSLLKGLNTSDSEKKPNENIILKKHNIKITDVFKNYIDNQDRIWCRSKNELAIESLDDPSQSAWFPLPQIRWKNFCDFLWKDNLICSDWAGNIWRFSYNTQRGDFVYKAKYDDTPFHCFSKNPSDLLVAGSWSGKIIRFTDYVDDTKQEDLFIHPNLPISVCALPNNTILVGDELSFITLYDDQNQLVWQKEIDGKIQRIQYTNEDEPAVYIFFQNNNKIQKLIIKNQNTKEIALKKHPWILSSNKYYTNHHWAIVISKDGEINWIDKTNFNILGSSDMKIAEEIKKLYMLNNPIRKNDRLAIGLTESGNIFWIDNMTTSVIENIKGNDILIDLTGNKIYVVTDDEINLVKNPALDDFEFKIKVHNEIEGFLEANKFKEIIIKITNKSITDIKNLKISLSNEGLINSAQEFISDKIDPNETREVKFLVKALEIGDYLPIKSKIAFEDNLSGKGYQQTAQLKVKCRN